MVPSSSQETSARVSSWHQSSGYCLHEHKGERQKLASFRIEGNYYFEYSLELSPQYGNVITSPSSCTNHSQLVQSGFIIFLIGMDKQLQSELLLETGLKQRFLCSEPQDKAGQVKEVGFVLNEKTSYA